MTTNEDLAPLFKMQKWIEQEKALGCPYPDRVVLATCSPEGAARSRIVVIKKLTAEGVLFFTQKNSKKVKELTHSPRASMTLWLALQQRQVILEGACKPLTPEENATFWAALPRERQLRFSAYAPTSGQEIASLSVLEQQLEALTTQFQGKEVPLSPHYLGFHLLVETMYFYTLRDTSFSESLKYKKHQNTWKKELISP